MGGARHQVWGATLTVAAVTVEGLGKCYRLGKQRLGAMEGLGQLLAILNLGGEKKELARDLWALSDVSFSVEPGEVLGIIGRNGAGKSTLLKTLARITLPTTGRATIQGRVVSLLELGAGFHPELTGRENIFLNAAFYGIGKDEVARHLDEIVAFAELEQFIDTPVRHYSSGMYVRLAFSNAIHMRPNVLLADEVLAVGDIHFQNRCMKKMQEISNSGITVLFVSHDMDAIERLCGRCIWLDKGKILDSGETFSVVMKYKSSVHGANQDDEPTEIFRANDYGPKGVQTRGTGKYSVLRQVLLLNDAGSEIGVIRADASFRVRVTIETLEPSIKVMVGIGLRCGEVVISRSVAPTLFDFNEARCWNIDIVFPEDILASKDYQIDIGVSSSMPGEKEEERIFAKEALKFRVYENVTSKVDDYEFVGRRPGVINPKLAWLCARAD